MQLMITYQQKKVAKVKGQPVQSATLYHHRPLKKGGFVKISYSTRGAEFLRLSSWAATAHRFFLLAARYLTLNEHSASFLPSFLSVSENVTFDFTFDFTRGSIVELFFRVE